jgi:outer membrane receptor protein involved in Fe transport
MTQRVDSRTFPPNQVPFNPTTLEGSRAANPVGQYDYTASVNATARFQLSPTVMSMTTTGAQYFRERNQTVFASGRKLASGTGSLSGIVIPTVNEGNTEAKTFGLFIEEQVAVGNRLFFTAALRGDDNSAFGRNFDFITYPKVGASWVISDEKFFPQGIVSSLRLRAAYGASGLQPGTTDAVQYFDPVAVTADNSDVGGFTFGNLGNFDLKPEKSKEVELGFDAGLLDDQLRLVFSYYDKSSRDALINRPLAPSLGVTAAQFFNLGEVSNKGVEIELSGRVLNRPMALWDFTFSAWGNRNRLIDLGTDFLGNDIPPIVFGTQRHVEGYPLGGYWVRRIQSFSDLNGDGIIANRPGAAEVVLEPAFSYMGTPYPTQGATLNTGITLGRRVRVSGLLDYRAGHTLYNLTADFRCRQNICPEINDRATPLRRQAEAYATVFLGSPEGYIEDADFLKLRELSLTYYFPPSTAARIGASGLSLTLAGRNLATWTGYSGFDPEVNQNAQANFATSDFLTQPPVRFFTARLNVTF